MEQVQSSGIPRVRFSVATRLLLGLLLLLVIFIAFLNISTIFVLSDDKKNYTYQQQGTEAALAGNEFYHLTQSGIDAIRQALGSFNPKIPLTEVQKNAIDALIQNQNEVIRLDMYAVNPEDLESQKIQSYSKLNKVRELGIEDDKPFELDPLILKEIMTDLGTESVSLQNASTVGNVALLAIAYSDKGYELSGDKELVTVAYLSLRGFVPQMSGTRLTVANSAGWVLYDTDPTSMYSKANVAFDEIFLRAHDSRVKTGAFELENDGKKTLGSFYRPGLNLSVMMNSQWSQVMEGTFSLVEKFLLLGILAIGAAILFGVIFSRAMTAPLKVLFEATKSVSTGNFDLALDIKRTDEIGALSGAFVTMSKKIGELIQEKLKQSALENELKIASTVQQTLIPEAVIDTASIKIRSYYQPAAVCGGDWWGFFTVDTQSCILIADATGHGLPSALITASIRSCFSMIQKMAEESSEFLMNPANLLSFANRVIFDAASGRIMMTLFAGVFDHEKGIFTYASAGHNPQWLFRKTGNTYKLTSLVVEGRRLGEMKQSYPYKEKQEKLQAGDIFFFYTDGLLENTNPAGAQFTKKKALRVIQENLGDDIQGVVDHLTVQVNQHNGEKMYDDDVTFACVQIQPILPSGSVT